MSSIISNIKNSTTLSGIQKQCKNDLTGFTFFFEMPLVEGKYPIFEFSPTGVKGSPPYRFLKPLKQYIEVVEHDNDDNGKVLEIIYTQPFINTHNKHFEPNLFINFDYLKKIGYHKIIFTVDADYSYNNYLTIYTKGSGALEDKDQLTDFTLHINNIGRTSKYISLCNIRSLKNVHITSNKPNKSRLNGIRWNKAWVIQSVDDDECSVVTGVKEYEEYKSSDFLYNWKHNNFAYDGGTFTNDIPGGLKLDIYDVNHEFIDGYSGIILTFEDESEDGFLYNLLQGVENNSKIYSHEFFGPDNFPEDIVLNINGQNRYYLYLHNISKGRFYEADGSDTIEYLNSISSGGIQWKMFNADHKYRFLGLMGTHNLFYGIYTDGGF